MKIEIHGKNVSITEAMQNRIDTKLSFLNKYLQIDEDTVAKVLIIIFPTNEKIEITIQTKVGLLRAEVVHEDLYAAIDLAIDKLEDQIRRQKTRLSRKHKEKLAMAFIEEDEEILNQGDIAVKTKTIAAQKMDLEEAIMRMEMVGHSFFIYTDIETDNIAVVYKRNQGGFGLIETE